MSPKWSHYLYQPWGWFNRCCGSVTPPLSGISSNCPPCGGFGIGQNNLSYPNRVKYYDFTFPTISSIIPCCADRARSARVSTESSLDFACRWHSDVWANPSGCGTATFVGWRLEWLSASFIPGLNENHYYLSLFIYSPGGGTITRGLAYQSTYYWLGLGDDLGYERLDCVHDEMLLYKSAPSCRQLETQKVTVSPLANGGSYKLALGGEVTADILWNESGNAVATKLSNAFSNCTTTVVGGAFSSLGTEITLLGGDSAPYSYVDFDELTVDTNNLTYFGNPCTVSVSTLQDGQDDPFPATLTLVASDV